MLKIFSLTKPYLLLHKFRLALYLLLCIVVSMAGLVTPYIIGDFIDRLLSADSINFIFTYFALFGSVNLASLALGYISGQLHIWLGATLAYAFNRDFISHIQQLPLRFTKTQDAAYLNQRINHDTNTLILFCMSLMQSVIVNIVVVCVALVLLFSFHPGLAVVLLIVAAVYFVLYAMYKNVLFRAGLAQKESQAAFFAKLNEQLANIRFVKLHSLFAHFIGRLNSTFVLLKKNSLRYQRASYIFGSMDNVVNIAAQMVLMLLGGREIIAGRLTIGRYIIIASYFNLMLGSVRYFFGLGSAIQNARVSYSRLMVFHEVSREPNGTQRLDTVQTIELRALNFGYTDSEALLRDINHKFARGRMHLVMGANGAGKSTLTDVIVGLYEGEYSGEVRYNGIPTQELDMYHLRNKHIGITEQEPSLLADTLENNLRFDCPSLLWENKSHADRLIDMLGLTSYVSTLSDGFSTVYNEASENLSGGEKQKLSLVRVLLKNPDVIVLDEPTSALDSASRAALFDYLHKIKHDKIIIVITHDSSIAEAGDVILNVGLSKVDNIV